MPAAYHQGYQQQARSQQQQALAQLLQGRIAGAANPYGQAAPLPDGSGKQQLPGNHLPEGLSSLQDKPQVKEQKKDKVLDGHAPQAEPLVL
ncbi:hypothetical protein ADICEAN_03684 [Cesiribacter andamanensis AMV16]|uniref:Uncharacterized protein n=1 Tax=Cesiribacter andamanensis AMV16 TaxID=1279009 RepID=M7NRU0_9BACT|nr:hypothetical protein ADICEAN_03684 [Cesiribacter andamanensis AMV16]